MKMKVAMYTGDHRNVNKSIDWIKDENGNDLFPNVRLKNGCNSTHPTIEISIDVIHPIQFNYIKLYWISETQKYSRCYFVESVTYEGKRAFLNCVEDFLYTFQNEILNLECNVIRQEHKYSSYIPDDRVLCSTKRQLEQLPRPSETDNRLAPFSTGGTGNPVVLTVSGGNS